MRKTRKDIIAEAKEFLSSFKKKPVLNSEDETFDLFSDYYDSRGSIFLSLTLDGHYYLLLCSEIIDDTEIYNMVLTSDNVDDVIAELDFDTKNSMYAFINSCKIEIPK